MRPAFWKPFQVPFQPEPLRTPWLAKQVPQCPYNVYFHNIMLRLLALTLSLLELTSNGSISPVLLVDLFKLVSLGF